MSFLDPLVVIAMVAPDGFICSVRGSACGDGFVHTPDSRPLGYGDAAANVPSRSAAEAPVSVRPSEQCVGGPRHDQGHGTGRAPAAG